MDVGGSNQRGRVHGCSHAPPTPPTPPPSHHPSPCRYVNGTNYSRTLEAWLAKHDAHKQQLMPIMESTYGGPRQGVVW